MPNRKPIDWALLPLTKYGDFNGRASRSEYWWFTLLAVVASMPAGIFDGMLGISIIGPLVSLGLLLPSLAVSVRRLHDLDHSGRWLLVPILAVILALVFGMLAGAGPRLANGRITPAQGGAMMFVLIGWLAMIFLLVAFCRRGTTGENRFGPDPVAETPNPTLYYG